MLEILAAAALLGGGGWFYLLVKRGRAHARWKSVLDQVAKELGGRASPGSMFDAPQLRAELEGLTVTLRLSNIHKTAASGIARAESKLPDNAGAARLYFGWDVAAAPTDLAHVPDVPATARTDGEVIAKADDAALASRFMDRAMIDLIDVRREANAHGLEVICRGGYLTLVLHGIQETAHMLERIVIVSARLAQLVGAIASGTALPEGKREVSLDLVCALCDEKYDGKPWVKCARCGSPYHRVCFEQAGACLVEGCGETASGPIETDG
jgi:hypothetical protein